ncbi:MAG: dihydroorotate dehydrogenase [Candidatus Bathyarchaeia archaeon]
MDLSVEIGGLKLKTPFLAASGVIGVSAILARRAFASGAGGVVAKSVGLKARDGYPGPNVVRVSCGLINAMGLPNPGIHEMVKELKAMKSFGVPVIASIYGFSEEEYGEAAKLIAEKVDVEGFELNLSCPTVYGTGFEIGIDPLKVRGAVKAVKEVVEDKPVIAKLTPNVTDIVSIGKAAEEAGADGVTAINTVRAMVIDVDLERPILNPGIGGLSGPAIKPIALRAVYELYRGLRIPVLGCGGITSWRDAVEFFLAGASAVQIGTGILYRDLKVFREVKDGLSSYLGCKGVADIKPLIGRAHKAGDLGSPLAPHPV